MPSMCPANNPKIDEGLYSRQLYVLGFDAMEKITGSKVLLIGLDGLGVEIAKNLLLGGVDSLIVYDNTKISLADLSTQFYLSDKDCGKPRAASSIGKLSDLNPYSNVVLIEEEPTEDLIRMMQVMIVSGLPMSECVKWNDLARQNGVHYICADTRGLFGYVFADFGPNFTVTDPDGEEPISHMISSVSRDETGTVTCAEDARHGLSDGVYIKFSEVRGMVELNGPSLFKVKVLGPFTFGIGDTSGFGEYESNGIFTEVKMPTNYAFKTLRESLKKPDFLISDFSKAERPIQLHIAFQTLSKFLDVHKRLPSPRSDSDAEKFLAVSKEVLSENNYDVDIDEKIIKEFSYQAMGALPSMTSVIGGFTSQEVFKACSGRFTPLLQFIYFDSLESLPKNSPLDEQRCAPLNTRYDPQIAVFGSDFLKSIHNSKAFLVGAGAIGCEMLKIWSLSGVGSGEEGVVIVTDMDLIERSNLNRQFLFKKEHIGQSKSEIACMAAEGINPDMKNKLISKQDRVGEDTEKIFDEDFWNPLSFVANALDNVEARKYVDSKCVFHRKPMVDSGTLGTKGNTQVVVPFITESYSSSHDPPEKSIPMCTLKNFPNLIEHTIQWSRDLFDGLYNIPVKNLQLYASDDKFLAKIRKQAGGCETATSIYDLMVKEKPSSFFDCVKWARYKFEELFSNAIRQLLFNFPPDTRTSSGAPFWSGPKRTPTPVKFDMDNELHMTFIVSASNLFSQMYNIAETPDVGQIKNMLAVIEVPAFQPRSGIKIAANDSELSSAGDPTLDVDDIISKIPPVQEVEKMHMSPLYFDKDNDLNLHMDFVYSAANIRATNYAIETAPRHKVKFIAGKIIPAIATTTSLISGLAMLELYKIIDGNKNIEHYKNGFVNLSLPFFSFSEPLAPAKGCYNDKKFTLWDRFEIEYDISLQELVNYFQKEHGLEISMISCGTTLVFAPFLNKKKAEERGGLPVSKVIEGIRKSPIPPHVRSLILDAIAVDKLNADVDIPYILVRVNGRS